MALTNKFIAKVSNRSVRFLSLTLNFVFVLTLSVQCSIVWLHRDGTKAASSAMSAARDSIHETAMKDLTRKFIAQPTTPRSSDRKVMASAAVPVVSKARNTSTGKFRRLFD